MKRNTTKEKSNDKRILYGVLIQDGGTHVCDSEELTIMNS